MATDKKSQHYTSAQNYTDLEGQSKLFTMVDHDRKTKISTMNEESDKDWKTSYRSSLIERILVITAAICPEPFSDFVLRGESRNTIGWNEKMLNDQGFEVSKLRELCTLLENEAELRRLI